MTKFTTTAGRWSVSTRLRAKLDELLKKDGYGAATALAKFSKDRPGGSNIQASEISSFLDPIKYPDRKRPINLDDLDDIAAYFRINVGELFNLKNKELSGDEERMIWAFRALPDVTQEHFLALLEAASVSRQFVTFRKRKDLQFPAESGNTTPLPGGIDAESVASFARPLSAQIAALATALREYADKLLSLEHAAREHSSSTRTEDHRPTDDGRPDETEGR